MNGIYKQSNPYKWMIPADVIIRPEHFESLHPVILLTAFHTGL